MIIAITPTGPRIALLGFSIACNRFAAAATEADFRTRSLHFNRAPFNQDHSDEFSQPFAAPAVVLALTDAPIRGRRGIYADNRLDLGKAAALRLDGLTVIVVTHRYRCADPAFFEAFGLDIAAARVVVVKSRGHFRGGFDEFFRHDPIIEVDAAGLTSPILTRFPWRHMPRPVRPIDDTAEWTLAT